MTLSIMSWNINSVRLRIEQVASVLETYQPDLVCLQEIKCQAHEFPHDAFIAAGYPHIHVTGQKGWHGVALVSKTPFETLDSPPYCRRGEARAQAIYWNGFELWNLYIPAGGDVPDREANDKFDHKLEFYERMSENLSTRKADAPLIILGDLNIAPGEYDVWSHKQMLKTVSHTPPELETFARFVESGQLFDPFRAQFPNPQRLFSWWSYRAADFRASNRGLRLDHILLNPALLAKIKGEVKAQIFDEVREREKPSDHAPIMVSFDCS